MDEVNELRYLQVAPPTVIDAEQVKLRKFTGYAAVFNSPSQKLGDGFIEIIRPGAFAETIKSGKIKALLNHNVAAPMGSQKAGTLRLWEDEIGLRFELSPADTSYVRDLQALVSHGDVPGCSFHIVKWTIAKTSTVNGNKVRELSTIDIDEISILTMPPAYEATSVSLRNKDKGTVVETPVRNRCKRMLLL